MGENLKTCQANLARFITEKGVLVHCINGEYALSKPTYPKYGMKRNSSNPVM